MTVAEAAKKLRVSGQRVRQMIKTNQLMAQATKEQRGTGKVWSIPAAALSSIRRAKIGRPKKKIA